MKNVIKILVITISFITVKYSIAQELNKSEIIKYAFMTGEWKGTGKAMNREKNVMEPFMISESIKFNVDSTIIMIEGIGESESGDKVHHAFGILYFDYVQQKCKMHSFIMQGMNTIADISLTDNGFMWGFDILNGAKMEYTAEFGEGTWSESGNYISPEGSKFPTLSMDLKKIK